MCSDVIGLERNLTRTQRDMCDRRRRWESWLRREAQAKAATRKILVVFISPSLTTALRTSPGAKCDRVGLPYVREVINRRVGAFPRSEKATERWLGNKKEEEEVMRKQKEETKTECGGDYRIRRRKS